MYAPREVAPGKQCGCICPACKDELISRHELNGHKIPHFAHAPGADCAMGFETAVHLAAKQLIKQEKRLFLPKAEAVLEKLNALGKIHRRQRVLIEEGIADLESVRLEVHLGLIRPDLVVVPTGQDEICVEIGVTHFVDATKLARVIETKMALLEINLSAYRSFTWDSLREALFTDTAPRRWLYQPTVEATTASWEEDLKPILAAIQKDVDTANTLRREIEAELAAKEAQAAKERENQLQARLADEKSVQAQKTRENRAEQQRAKLRARRFRARTEAEKLAILRHTYGRNQLPSVLAALVEGSRSFNVQDALIWQATLFRGLIDGAVAKGVTELNKDRVVAWLKERFKISAEFPDSEKIATWYYLVELTKRGALVQARESNFRFKIKVTTLEALEILQAFRHGSITPLNGLRWTALDTWPEEALATRIALAHSGSSHLYGDWQLVSAILPAVCTKPIVEILHYYVGTIGETALLEYWISAGFVTRE